MSRYTKLGIIREKGYVVNSVNVIQLDICIPFDRKYMDRYKFCIINQVEFTEINEETLEESQVIKMNSYRCRLAGIYSSSGIYHDDEKKESILKAESYIMDIIKKNNFNFICLLGDIDIYNRILVELIDPITGEHINKRLLDDYKDIFRSYSLKRY